MTPLSKGPEYYYQVLASKSLRQLDTLKNGLPWIGFLQDFSIIPVWFDDQFDLWHTLIQDCFVPRKIPVQLPT